MCSIGEQNLLAAPSATSCTAQVVAHIELLRQYIKLVAQMIRSQMSWQPRQLCLVADMQQVQPVTCRVHCACYLAHHVATDRRRWRGYLLMDQTASRRLSVPAGPHSSQI